MAIARAPLSIHAYDHNLALVLKNSQGVFNSKAEQELDSLNKISTKIQSWRYIQKEEWVGLSKALNIHVVYL